MSINQHLRGTTPITTMTLLRENEENIAPTVLSLNYASLNDILFFLANIFWCSYSYKSLNVYQSAISSLHPRIDGLLFFFVICYETVMNYGHYMLIFHLHPPHITTNSIQSLTIATQKFVNINYRYKNTLCTKTTDNGFLNIHQPHIGSTVCVYRLLQAYNV